MSEVQQASPFHSEGYRKVWARLRARGTRTSKERVRRLMREDDLQAPHFPQRVHGSKAHDGRIPTDEPDEMWGTDATSVMTSSEGQATILLAVDHRTAEREGSVRRGEWSDTRRWSRSGEGSASTSVATRRASALV